jgi:hypothetical protein
MGTFKNFKLSGYTYNINDGSDLCANLKAAATRILDGHSSIEN